MLIILPPFSTSFLFLKSALGLTADRADVIVRLLADITLMHIATNRADIGLACVSRLRFFRIFGDDFPHHNAVMAFLPGKDFHFIGIYSPSRASSLALSKLTT